MAHAVSFEIVYDSKIAKELWEGKNMFNEGDVVHVEYDAVVDSKGAYRVLDDTNKVTFVSNARSARLDAIEKAELGAVWHHQDDGRSYVKVSSYSWVTPSHANYAVFSNESFSYLDVANTGGNIDNA